MKKTYKILAINGSHRLENGISEILLNRFLKGSLSAGAEYRMVYSSRMKVNPCRACYRCIVKTPGVCFQQDDMPNFREAMDEADLLLMAAPVYFDSMPSDMKRIFERFMPLLGPVFEFREGRTYHLNSAGKELNTVVILLCGNPERESLASTQATFRRIIKNMHWNLAGEFLFPSSQMVVSHAGKLHDQLTALEEAGREMVLQNSVNRETMEVANKIYITDFQADIEAKNKAFSEMMMQNGL